jgi:hypothetical protein
MITIVQNRDCQSLERCVEMSEDLFSSSFTKLTHSFMQRFICIIIYKLLTWFAIISFPMGRYNVDTNVKGERVINKVYTSLRH